MHVCIYSPSPINPSQNTPTHTDPKPNIPGDRTPNPNRPPTPTPHPLAKYASDIPPRFNGHESAREIILEKRPCRHGRRTGRMRPPPSPLAKKHMTSPSCTSTPPRAAGAPPQSPTQHGTHHPDLPAQCSRSYHSPLPNRTSKSLSTLMMLAASTSMGAGPSRPRPPTPRGPDGRGMGRVLSLGSQDPMSSAASSK